MTELTNEKIDEIEILWATCRLSSNDLINYDEAKKLFRKRTEFLIHQAEIKACLDEMTNLLNDATSQHYAMWKQKVESRIEALEKEIVE